MKPGSRGIANNLNRWQQLMQDMTRIVQNDPTEIGVSCVTENLKWGAR